ncbi:MAG: insulinase family protein, partial [Thermoplasmatota archaeon]
MIARASTLFLPTLREAPAEAESASHKLLVRGGFIRQVGAGLWTFLPLGWRVHQKIVQIIREEIDAIGGESNAFTGKEYTGYYVKCAAESRDVALDVLVDMLRNSKFDPGEIDREKGVIIEEMNMYYDTPRDFISGVYEELLY